MLFLYGLFLKALSKLRLGVFFYPLFTLVFHSVSISLPTISHARRIIYNNTCHRQIKEKNFHYNHNYSCGYEYNIQIVIPVYNSKKYLRQCLNSVLNQKTKYKYQIIVVNDGSNDGSTQILKQYASNSLIKIINEKNYGSSVARNTGLRFVNSKYVMFVDSDDKLASNAIQDLLSKAYETHADVILGGSYDLFNNGTIKNSTVYNNCDKINLKTSNCIDGGPVAKIFKSSLFKDVYFPEGYTFEDMMLFFLIYPQCEKISSINSKIYFVRNNNSSVSHRFKFNDMSVDSFLLLNLMIRSLRKYNISINSYIYNTFLDQVKATCGRNIYINTKIQKSIFVLICHMYNKYFKGCSTNIKSNIPLEKILENKDYMGYILFCIIK